MLSRIPPVTRALLIANVAVFVLQLLLGDALTDWLALWPLGSEARHAFDDAGTFMPWQLLTYGFAHGDFMHLFFNMLALYMFGAPLESVWGERRFATYFLVAIIGAGLCQLIVAAVAGSQSSVVGASGAVYALLLVRNAVPEPEGDAAVPADSDEGAYLRDPVRRRCPGAGHDRPAAGCGPFRAPGRNDQWVADDPSLAQPGPGWPGWWSGRRAAPGPSPRRQVMC